LKLKGKDANSLREIADKIKDKNESCAVLLASDLGDKVLFVAAVTKDLVQKGINAGNMVKEAAKAEETKVADAPKAEDKAAEAK